ncbi:MAG: hypothetical protein WCG79_01600 [Verrucomicrobiota bacterium]|jgi:molecular chaperone DnaK (HSP70)
MKRAMVNDSINVQMAAWEQGVKAIAPIVSAVSQSLDTTTAAGVGKEQLREALSHSGNLRKKDFDRMLAAIAEPENKHAEEMRPLLHDFLKSQQKMIELLDGYFAQIRRSMETGDIGQIETAFARVKEIIAQQEQAGQELERDLAEQEKGQQEIQTGMKSLLQKGRELGIHDFKEMLDGIQRHSQERIEQNERRREAVAQMLAGYKEQRLKSESERRTQ